MAKTGGALTACEDCFKRGDSIFIRHPDYTAPSISRSSHRIAHAFLSFCFFFSSRFPPAPASPPQTGRARALHMHDRIAARAIFPARDRNFRSSARGWQMTPRALGMRPKYRPHGEGMPGAPRSDAIRPHRCCRCARVRTSLLPASARGYEGRVRPVARATIFLEPAGIPYIPQWMHLPSSVSPRRARW